MAFLKYSVILQSHIRLHELIHIWHFTSSVLKKFLKKKKKKKKNSIWNLILLCYLLKIALIITVLSTEDSNDYYMVLSTEDSTDFQGVTYWRKHWYYKLFQKSNIIVVNCKRCQKWPIPSIFHVTLTSYQFLKVYQENLSFCNVFTLIVNNFRVLKTAKFKFKATVHYGLWKNLHALTSSLRGHSWVYFAHRL